MRYGLFEHDLNPPDENFDLLSLSRVPHVLQDYPDDAIEMGQKSVRIANDLYQARAEMAQMLCMSTILIKVPELSAVAFEREAWTERGSTTRVFVPSLSIEP